MNCLILLLTMLFAQEKTPIEKLFEKTSLDLSAAERNLEQTYLRMETLFAQMGTEIEATSRTVAEAIRNEAPAFQERMLHGRQGKPPTKAAQLIIAQEGIGSALAATEIDPAFNGPLVQNLAEPLLPTLLDVNFENLEERVLQSLREVFLSEEPFAAVWNERLFQHVPAAQEYARAHRNYIEVGQRFERTLSPERFDAEGQRLPPGMVEVRGGSYQVGPHSGWERKGIGKRGKRVTLRSFFIDRTEVTNGDYQVFWKSLSLEDQLARVPRFWEKQPDGGYLIPEGRENHPVVGISFNDALAYAHWSGKRLPTEFEWEAAARGPLGLQYPWGDEYEAGRANDRDAALGDTAPVGSFPDGMSGCGCLDLAGNVEEWTSSTAEGDDINEPLESSLIQVVIRGGHFNTNADGVAGTFRWISPGVSTRKSHLGFRCALTAEK
ncbi:MAG: SUMF1/EgtB/PvdO family nonheme iron enzyme [Planctomycetota bacterium]